MPVTKRIFGEIEGLLKDGGIFLFCVNAVGDRNYGGAQAGNGWRLYDVNDVPKQFFNEHKIKEALGKRLSLLSIELKRSDRYGKTKIYFECLARKNNAAGYQGT
jgi:hypothetical protein